MGTVEDAVALCEGGFGYDVAMIVASIADLAEDLDQSCMMPPGCFSVRSDGLTERAALAFHEAGFTDRHVARFLESS